MIEPSAKGNKPPKVANVVLAPKSIGNTLPDEPNVGSNWPGAANTPKESAANNAVHDRQIDVATHDKVARKKDGD